MAAAKESVPLEVPMPFSWGKGKEPPFLPKYMTSEPMKVANPNIIGYRRRNDGDCGWVAMNNYSANDHSAEIDQV